MAKIKVKGVFDTIEGPDSQAVELRDGMQAGTIKTGDFIRFGQWSGKASEVAGIFVYEGKGPSAPRYEQGQRDYEARTRHLLSLSPEERAKETSWGIFTLWHWGAYGRAPKDNEKSRKLVTDATAAFYRERPKRTLPAVTVFEALMKRTNREMNGMAAGILLSCEKNQLGLEEVEENAVQIA